MANHNKISASERAQQRRRELAREENRRKYEAERAHKKPLFIGILAAVTLIALIALIVTLSADVVYIHNTGMTEDGGREVTVSGIALLNALFTDTFTSASAEYDNLAVPFYYYAEAWCKPLAAFTFLSVLVTAISMLVSLVALVAAIGKKEYLPSWFSLIGTALSLLMIAITFFIAVSMSGSQILPQYCLGNPACSIQSDLIWCFILTLAALAGGIVAVIQFQKLDKLRKAVIEG